MRHEHVVDCPDCGARMFSVTWDDSSPYIRRIKRAVQRAQRASRKGHHRPLDLAGRKAEAAQAAEVAHAVVGDVIRRDQAARLDRSPQVHYHRCGVVLVEVGDATAPLGRALEKVRGRGEGRPDEAPPGLHGAVEAARARARGRASPSAATTNPRRNP